MQITIQSLEVTYQKVPYRFLVKKVYNSCKNEVSFHCWAPEDNSKSKDLLKGEIVLFEWDNETLELKPDKEVAVANELRQAIKASFADDRA
jgi:hypothetical protein